MAETENFDLFDRKARPTVVYMCYDGVLEPLGKSQVVAYLEGLADAYAFHLISFEKPVDLANSEDVTEMSLRLRKAGIVWHMRRYHRHPKVLSTLWDMATAMFLAIWLVFWHRAALLHARSVLCAAMLYPARLLSRARFLVDIRGFWVDERVDGGMIRADGLVYRVLKVVEKAMLRRADHIVTLTRSSVPFLRDDPRLGQTAAPITVIPTCADLTLFSPDRGARSGPFTIGYVGQVGKWYMLEEMLSLFAIIRRHRPDARLLIVNKDQQDIVRQALAKSGIERQSVEVVGVAREEMPVQIRRMDAALTFTRPCFSEIARAPTKFAEYLGCGIPVVGNVGGGDMARFIADDEVGVVVANTDPQTMEIAVAELFERLSDPELAARCITSAQRHFSLREGVAGYRSVYRSMIDRAA